MGLKDGGGNKRFVGVREMNHPEKKRRRRYRLNIKRFAAVLLALGFTASLVVLAAMSLANAADAGVVTVGDFEQIPDTGEMNVQKTGATENTLEHSGRLIVVDAGHGGFDPGAIGVGGSHEADLNLEVAQYLKTELEAGGIKVEMTRETDIGLGSTQMESLEERGRIIKSHDCDIAVSIHMNFFEDDSDVTGPLVLFMPRSKQGKVLADAVQKSMNEVLEASGTVRSESLYVLKCGCQPSVLIECGYLSNEQEEKKLCEPTYQKSIAKAICEGIKQYFSQERNNG